MRIGLLQCDDVTPELREAHGNYPDMLETLFRGVEPSLEFRVWRCHDGEIPEAIDSVDIWMTTGSKHGVNDGLPWIETLCGFVRELWAAGKPLIGICFGHQLMAKALGGEVVKSERGWGVGMSFNRVQAQSEWMEPWQPSLDLLVSHQDQVETLPAESEVLAGSDFCPYYLMQIGEHFLGIQGHPEFTKEYSRDLMALRREQVGAERVRVGEASLGAADDATLMARWIVNFMRRAVAQRT